METLSIPLNDSLKSFVDAEVASGGFRNASEYVQALLHDAKRRKAVEKVNQLIQEGIDSGEATPWTKQDLENVKREILERHARRTRKKP